MGEFLEQAEHNHRLLEILDQQFPDHFFDWKITIAFYSLVHYMNAYLCAEGRGIFVGSHVERNNHLNPAHSVSVFPLNDDHFDKFYDIYTKSRAVRYHGIRNRTVQLAKWKADYMQIRPYYDELKIFVKDDLNV